MPVYLISGSDDWVCPVDAALEGCGHNVQYTEPGKFAATVKELLK